MFSTFDRQIAELETATVPLIGTAEPDASALNNFWLEEVNPPASVNDFIEADYFQVKSTYGNYSAAEIESLLLANYHRAFDPLGLKLSDTKREQLSRGTRTTFKFVDPNRNVHVDIAVVDGPKGYFYIQGNAGPN